MPDELSLKNVGLLCVKFLVAVSACLVAWLQALPAYTLLVGHGTALLLRHIFRKPIDDVIVTAAGFMNTETSLAFRIGASQPTMNDVGHLMFNVAPFVALVLATSGLGLIRRVRIIAVGFAILYVSHVVTVVVRFIAGRTPIPTAIGFLSITLPFLLWIVLAFWDKLALFTESAPAPGESSRGSGNPS